MAVPSPALLAVQHHLVSHLGAPTEVLEQGPDAKLMVAHFGPTGASAPEVLSTCGASRSALPDGRRVELLTILRPAPDRAGRAAIMKLLARLGGLALQKTALGPGVVLPAAGELSLVSTHDSLLLLPPSTFIPTFQRFERRDGKTVEWLWCVPVSPPEAEYVKAQGLKALLSQFGDQGVELADWGRPGLGRFLRPGQAEEALEAREAALRATRPAPSKPARPRAAAPQARPAAPLSRPAAPVSRPAAPLPRPIPSLPPRKKP